MADYMLLMHELPNGMAYPDWGPYLAKLGASGHLRGGSAIGGGLCVRRDSGDTPDITRHIGGYIKVEAESLDAAKDLLAGNPVYEAGGVVEIRELPRSDEG